jgi:DNA-binding transcriptional MerR regulator
VSGKPRQKSDPGQLPGYKLEELAERTGLNPRTIRSYIQRRLIAGPNSRGRHARYFDSQLARLLAIVELRNERGLGLDETRRLLATMTETEIRDLAGLSPTVSGATAAEIERSTAKSALQYLDEVMGGGSSQASSPTAQADGVATGPTEPTSSADTTDRSGSADQLENRYQRMLEELGSADDADAPELTSGSVQVPSAARRLARAEAAYEIEITPDIALHVRGEVDREALRRLERLADYFRHALTGGFDDQRSNDD